MLRDPLVVAGRPSTTGLTWWILAAAEQPQLRLVDAEGDITVHRLRDLGDGLRVFLAASTGLAPDRAYRLHVGDDEGREALGIARTLPDALRPGQPFTIALGSCYNWPMDTQTIFQYFPPAGHGWESEDPIRLTFLLGDQIYMDLDTAIDLEKPDAYSKPLAQAPDPWHAYLEQWTDDRYRRLLEAKNSFLCVADDHEMWNDFPHTGGNLLEGPIWLNWTTGQDGQKLRRRLQNAFDVFQAGLNLSPESVGNAGSITHKKIRDEGYTFRIDAAPLSFFALDTRFGRDRVNRKPRASFTTGEHMEAVLDWLKEPGGVGVLAVGPPVFEQKGGARDHNLANYEEDYHRLVNGLATAPRPILVLAGDIHYSRLLSLFVDSDTAHPVVEFVSSPFSRLKEPPGIAPPAGPSAAAGVLRDSGAAFRLETTDTEHSGSEFVATERQSYGTVTFTPAHEGDAVEIVLRCWTPPTRRRRRARQAHLLLQRTMVLPTTAP